MKTFILLALAALPAFGAVSSKNAADFCVDRMDPQYVKQLAREEANRMSFRNHGGFFGGGVCWWHSRFQRNALYLTYYSPNAPIQTEEEVRALVRNIRNGNGIQEIRGFKNFLEFSNHFEAIIQKELEYWQRFETRWGTFIRGLRGSSKVSAEWMEKLMGYLYDEVEIKNNIAYQKLQLKGVVAHAWLVISMKKDDKGYDLEVIDSNFPRRTSNYRYNYGDTHLIYPYFGRFVPYLEMENETEWNNESITDFCQKSSEG
jgi:hypothetical protein